MNMSIAFEFLLSLVANAIRTFILDTFKNNSMDPLNIPYNKLLKPNNGIHLNFPHMEMTTTADITRDSVTLLNLFRSHSSFAAHAFLTGRLIVFDNKLQDHMLQHVKVKFHNKEYQLFFQKIQSVDFE